MKTKLLCIIAVACSVSCLHAQSNFKFKGRVENEKGKGIAGVVLTNGVDFTITGSKGDWTLPTDTNISKHIVVSTPALYKLPEKRGVADGYFVAVKDLINNRNRHTFVLESRDRVDSVFYQIAISDPQVKNNANLKRWKNETVRDIKCLVDSINKEHEVVGVTLGDIVYDTMNLYPQMKESFESMGLTMFACIGNHDHNEKYQDLHNMALGSPVYAEKDFHKYFGPTDYSFNIGKAHIVVIKNINYLGGKKYVEALTGQQLEWLRKDLSYVPKGSLVILNMHAAGWNPINNGGNIRNANWLAEILADYDVHIFAGHTHYFHNNEVNKNLYEHNIGAACGKWWSCDINRYGVPNGYMLAEISGSRIMWHYKPTKGTMEDQFKVYGVGQFASQKQYIVANVWDYDSACKVEWEQDGVKKGKMERFTDADEGDVATQKDRKGAMKTDCLFRAKPDDKAEQVKIVVTNRFGEKYEKIITINSK